MIIDPTYYQLPKRTVLKAISNRQIAIVKDIKSRIVLKDAIRIKEMADLIKAAEPTYEVSLICNRNICSKSIAFLTDYKIAIAYF